MGVVHSYCIQSCVHVRNPEAYEICELLFEKSRSVHSIIVWVPPSTIHVCLTWFTVTSTHTVYTKLFIVYTTLHIQNLKTTEAHYTKKINNGPPSKSVNALNDLITMAI